MKHLLAILEHCSYSYELIQHERAIVSAQDGADYLGIEIGQTAPTLILKTEKGYVAAILSGNRGKLNFAEAAQTLGCRVVKLATAKEVQSVTGFEVGSVPMVGLDMPFVMDKELYRYPYVYGGTGDRGWTLKIEPKALEELNRVEIFLK